MIDYDVDPHYFKGSDGNYYVTKINLAGVYETFKLPEENYPILTPENTFNVMFLVFILNHCYETEDGVLIGDTFKDLESKDFAWDFNRLVELFLKNNYNDNSYLGCKAFEKEDIKNKLKDLLCY